MFRVNKGITTTCPFCYKDCLSHTGLAEHLWNCPKLPGKKRVNWNSGIASIVASIVIIALCSFCLPDRRNWPGGGGDEADQKACKKCSGTGSCGSCGGTGMKSNDKACGSCNGTGSCSSCQGSGMA